MTFPQKRRVLINLLILQLVSGVFSNFQIKKNEELLGRESLKIIFPYFEPVNFLQRYTDFSESRSPCDTDLGLYFEALQRLELWALKSK